ncbi:MAG: hypothetical protein AB1453_04455 [Chloroflexota bacterium]
MTSRDELKARLDFLEGARSVCSHRITERARIDALLDEIRRQDEPARRLWDDYLREERERSDAILAELRRMDEPIRRLLANDDTKQDTPA